VVGSSKRQVSGFPISAALNLSIPSSSQICKLRAHYSVRRCRRDHRVDRVPREGFPEISPRSVCSAQSLIICVACCTVVLINRHTRSLGHSRRAVPPALLGLGNDLALHATEQTLESGQACRTARGPGWLLLHSLIFPSADSPFLYNVVCPSVFLSATSGQSCIRSLCLANYVYPCLWPRRSRFR
jgi:hypothetical protein